MRHVGALTFFACAGAALASCQLFSGLADLDSAGPAEPDAGGGAAGTDDASAASSSGGRAPSTGSGAGGDASTSTTTSTAGSGGGPTSTASAGTALASGSATGGGGAPGCGDGELGPDEECDDTNVDGGDGCSSDCRLECGEPTAVAYPRLQRCYWVNHTQLAFYAADTGCGVVAGGRLAILPDAEAVAFARAISGYSFAWVGADACGAEACDWLDEAVEWTFGQGDWADGEPSNEGNQCLVLARSGAVGFQDHTCTQDLWALCEVRPLD